MQFVALDGSIQEAETWSPGPFANSVWCLHADGRPVAPADAEHVDLSPAARTY